eukprot:704784-Prymnesium_polylepis.1
MAAAHRNLQVALFTKDKFDAALEAAEAARSRSLEVLLARQRQVSEGLFAISSPEGRSLKLQDLRLFAARQGAALLVYSQVSKTSIQAWVVGSAQSDTFVAREISIPQGDASLTQLVDQMRHILGTRDVDAGPRAEAIRALAR